MSATCATFLSEDDSSVLAAWWHAVSSMSFQSFGSHDRLRSRSAGGSLLCLVCSLELHRSVACESCSLLQDAIFRSPLINSSACLYSWQMLTGFYGVHSNHMNLHSGRQVLEWRLEVELEYCWVDFLSFGAPGGCSTALFLMPFGEASSAQWAFKSHWDLLCSLKVSGSMSVIGVVKALLFWWFLGFALGSWLKA